MKQLKYGWIKGPKCAVPVPMAASQTIKDQSGKFVYMDDGGAKLCEDAAAYIFGHLEIGTEDGSITPSAGDMHNCIIGLSDVFRIPVDSGTYVVGMIGDLCDLAISDDVQGAQLDASAENLLFVVGGDADDNNYVDVMVNPEALASADGGVED